MKHKSRGEEKASSFWARVKQDRKRGRVHKHPRRSLLYHGPQGCLQLARAPVKFSKRATYRELLVAVRSGDSRGVLLASDQFWQGGYNDTSRFGERHMPASVPAKSSAPHIRWQHAHNYPVVSTAYWACGNGRSAPPPQRWPRFSMLEPTQRSIASKLVRQLRIFCTMDAKWRSLAPPRHPPAQEGLALPTPHPLLYGLYG